MLQAKVKVFLDLKQYENKLFNSGLRFKSTINASPVPQALIDENTRFTFFDPAFIDTFGYSMGDVASLDDWWKMVSADEMVLKQLKAEWEASLTKAKEQGSAFEPLETSVRCKDGSIRSVIASMAPLDDYFAGEHLIILFDITERLKAEAKLAKANEEMLKTSTLLDGILRNMSDWVWEVDAKGRYTFCSQKVLQHLGIHRLRCLGKLLWTLCRPNRRGALPYSSWKFARAKPIW